MFHSIPRLMTTKVNLEWWLERDLDKSASNVIPKPLFIIWSYSVNTTWSDNMLLLICLWAICTWSLTYGSESKSDSRIVEKPYLFVDPAGGAPHYPQWRILRHSGVLCWGHYEDAIFSGNTAYAFVVSTIRELLLSSVELVALMRGWTRDFVS